MTPLQHVLEFIGVTWSTSPFRSQKTGMQLLESRIRQAATEGTLLGFCQKITELLDSTPNYQDMTPLLEGIKADGDSILHWLNTHFTIAALLARQFLRDRDGFTDAVGLLDVASMSPGDAMLAQPEPDIRMKVTLLSPLSHGSDQNAGNATLFRRQRVLARNGGELVIPYYSGNAVRGQARDLLADHFSEALGLEPSRSNQPWVPWAFHLLYAGGALGDKSHASAPKEVLKKIGERANATTNIDERRALRMQIPPLSLLGCSVGSTPLGGKVDVLDCLPVCRQCGNGKASVDSLMSWEYLTRRDDVDEILNEGENTSMIATHEVMRTGSVLLGGFDLRPHMMDIDRACMARVLDLLRERAVLGGNARRGWGKVAIEYEGADVLGDPEVYDDHLREHRAEILEYLRDLGAIKAEE